MNRQRNLAILVAAIAALCLWLLLDPGGVEPHGEPVRQEGGGTAPVVPSRGTVEREASPDRAAEQNSISEAPGRAEPAAAGGLHGVVKEYSAGGAPGMRLELIGADGVTLLATTADEKGQFAFDRVVEEAQTLITRPGPAGLPVLQHDRLPIRSRDRITLWVPPRGVISGTVVDETGAPVPNATVLTDRPYMPMGMPAWRVVEGEQPKASFQAKADARGRFEFRSALRGTHRLRATHDDRTGSIKVGAGARGVVIRLGTYLGGSTTISGQLTHRQTGDPIRDARVWIHRVSRSEGGSSSISVATPRTDREGRYEASGLDEGSYRVTASPAGFAPIKAPVRECGPGHHVVDMSLTPSRTLVVSVREPDGTPASGIQVSGPETVDDSTQVAGWLASARSRARTNGDGVATLKLVPAGRVTLVAVRGDFAAAGRVEVDLRLAVPDEVVITMPTPAVRFARNHFFVLHDAQGKAARIDGVVVASCIEGDALLSRVEGRWRGKKFVLGNHGQYDFTNPTIAVGAPVGSCRVEIAAPGYQPLSLILEPGASSPTVVRLLR